MKNKIKVGKTVFPLAAISVSTLFLITIATTIPTAMAADPQSRILYCKEGAEMISPNPQTDLTVDLAVNEIVGETVTAYAVLKDGDGSPIVAAPVHFYASNEAGPSLWVGHAITDCEGVAILRFNRNEAGPIEITAKFDGENGLISNEITARLELKRLAPEEPGILEIGSIGVTLLLSLIVSVAVLGAVFAVREDRKAPSE